MFVAQSKPGLALAVAGSVLGHLALVAVWSILAPAPSALETTSGRPPLQIQLWTAASPTAPVTAPAATADTETPPEPSSRATTAAPQAPANPADGFVPSTQLDRPVLPKSEADLKQLEGLSFTGYPIRLRLFIDAAGSVVDVAVLQAHADDDEAVEQMRAMFLATAYMPGQLHGRLVPSRTDIELSLAMLQP